MGRRHNVFGVDPVCIGVGIGIGLTLSFLHNIIWTSGWILTKFSWIHNWDITKNCSDFRDLDLIFKDTAVEKLKICDTGRDNILWTSGWILNKFSWIHNWDIKKLIIFWWPWPNFQGHSSRKTENSQWGGGGWGRWWWGGYLFSLKTLLLE